MSADEADPVARLEGLVAKLGQIVQADRDQHAQEMGELRDELAALRGGEPIELPEMGDATAWIDRATSEEWTALADWVDWLSTTYELTEDVELRPCWPHHPGVAEELEAVRLAWVNAVQRTASGDDPDGMAFWHDRYLAPLVQRLPSLYRIKTCRRGHQAAPTAPVTDRGLLPGA